MDTLMDTFDSAGNLREFPSQLAGSRDVHIDSEVRPTSECASSAPMDDAAPVMVTVDLTESAGRILVAAGKLADKLGSPLVVAHVVHDSIDHPGLQAKRRQINGSRMEPRAKVARRVLDGILADEVGRLPEIESLRDARIVLVDGLPVGRILELAEREQPRMIVMGSGARGGLSRMLARSVAKDVVRKSGVPVTVVNAED